MSPITYLYTIYDLSLYRGRLRKYAPKAGKLPPSKVGHAFILFTPITSKGGSDPDDSDGDSNKSVTSKSSKNSSLLNSPNSRNYCSCSNTFTTTVTSTVRFINSKRFAKEDNTILTNYQKFNNLKIQYNSFKQFNNHILLLNSLNEGNQIDA
ncbi:hypothetical protein GE21DRAFT_1273212 [Neurospora crassa]|nr:hypothetical protein GE21DRAFT_1273212 [Neurospora crassa]